MTHIVLAPCSPFSVTPELMKQSAQMARHYGLHLHTHLAETEDEQDFCLERFGHRPVAYMQSLDWVGPDVWFAHSVHINHDEIEVYAAERCGVAHCPTSNMRLASGVPPIQEMLAAGVNVGLGVDGSASNDGSHLLAEVRQAMLLARLKAGLDGFSRSEPPSPSGTRARSAAEGRGAGGEEETPTPSTLHSLMTAREALRLGTRGGADVLGRVDIGSLEPGKCADFFAVNLNRLEYAGAQHDPLAAIVFCQPGRVDYTVVGGKFVVREGELVTLDAGKLVERHNGAARRLVDN